MALILENENSIKIKYDEKIDSYDKLNFILYSFCYSILMNKKELNKVQLQNYSVSEYTIFND